MYLVTYGEGLNDSVHSQLDLRRSITIFSAQWLTSGILCFLCCVAIGNEAQTPFHPFRSTIHAYHYASSVRFRSTASVDIFSEYPEASHI